jgi:hypothetical protein
MFVVKDSRTFHGASAIAPAVCSYVQRYGSFADERVVVIHLSICLAYLESSNAIKGWDPVSARKNSLLEHAGPLDADM